MSVRDAILARLALAERDEESIPLGETLHLRELTRAQVRDARAWAATTDLAERERARGAQLALAVSGALTEDQADVDALKRAIVDYYLGTPEQATDTDRWHAALFAAGVVDPETKTPLFERAEILAWPSRVELWDEVIRIDQAILDISEIGESHLKKESSDSSPRTG